MAKYNDLDSTQSQNFITKLDNGITERYQMYILGGFERSDTTELIGNLGAIVHSLTPQPIYKQSSKIISPYDIDETDAESTPTIIDIYIDSCGGDTRILNNILSLLSLAKMRGAIIRTTVLSAAYSCGSLLAIQGTPGYRIMSQNAEHLVHYGTTNLAFKSEEEKTELINWCDRQTQNIFSMYENYTKLPKNILKNTKKYSEGRRFDAPTSLKYGLCDWILKENGTIQGRTR